MRRWLRKATETRVLSKLTEMPTEFQKPLGVIWKRSAFIRWPQFVKAEENKTFAIVTETKHFSLTSVFN